MTNQESINILLNERKCIDRNDGIQCDRKCESCDLVMDAEPIREAYSMAISALQKQIPKKAVRDKTPRYGMGYEYYDWVCPTCGRFLAFECDRGRNNIHHCKCGQAIDWEKE